MRWLGWLNFLVLQWFFVRYAAIVEDDHRVVGWVWMTRVVPLTGWGGFNYWYIGPRPWWYRETTA